MHYDELSRTFPFRVYAVQDDSFAHKRRKGLVEPQVIPPSHRRNVTEPHVCDFMAHDTGSILLATQPHGLIVQKYRGSSGNQTPVLHRSKVKVRRH